MTFSLLKTISVSFFYADKNETKPILCRISSCECISEPLALMTLSVLKPFSYWPHGFLAVFVSHKAQKLALYKDHLLPYMVDATHAPDTLFLVMEEDWRLYPQEGLVNAEKVVAVMQQTLPRRQQGESSIFQESLNEGGATGQPYMDVDKVLLNPHTHGGEPFALPNREGEGGRPSDEPFATLSRSTFEGALGAELLRTRKKTKGEVSEEVKDLVKICTMAHRQWKGNLVWLSWEGSSSKGCRCQPQHGATLIGVSVEGAKRLQAAVVSEQIKKGHFDLTLLQWLRDPEAMGGVQGADWLGASFVWPGVGSYVEHQSGCDPGIGVRESSWKKSWVQPGTRASGGDDQNRWLCGFTNSKKGNPVWIREIFLPEKSNEDLRWFTLGRDPEEESAAAGGGAESDGEQRRSRGKKQRFGWETWPSDWQHKESKRGKRNYRSKMAGYARRHFTTVFEEARTHNIRCINICILDYDIVV